MENYEGVNWEDNDLPGDDAASHPSESQEETMLREREKLLKTVRDARLASQHYILVRPPL